MFSCLVNICVSTHASPTFKAWLYSRKIYRGIFDCLSRLKQLLFISATVLYNLAHVYEDIGSRWKSRLTGHSFSVLLVLSTNFHFFFALCCLQKVHFGSDSLDKISKTIKEKVCASVLLFEEGNHDVDRKEGVCECNPVWRKEPMMVRDRNSAFKCTPVLKREPWWCQTEEVYASVLLYEEGNHDGNRHGQLRYLKGRARYGQNVKDWVQDACLILRGLEQFGLHKWFT